MIMRRALSRFAIEEEQYLREKAMQVVDACLMKTLFRVILSMLLLSSSVSAEPCISPPGIEALESASVVVIGEYHGTNEIPVFFFDVVCTLANESKGTLVVGLELPEAFNPIFARIGSATPDKLIDEIRKVPFWDRYADGRPSRANLELLENLVRLAAKRGQTKVVAYAGMETDIVGAQILARAMREHSADKMVVLAGNAHARLLPTSGGPPTHMAAELLNRHGLDVLTLNISAGSGEVWICLGELPCGPRAVLVQRRAPGIHLDGCVVDCVYHGVYHLDKVSISPAVDRD